MTHDELLAEIEDMSLAGFVAQKLAYTLRAVVELHKPITMPNNFSYCPECQYGHARGVYPCPTIQAIEKELK
jgi:hypothetical protein